MAKKMPKQLTSFWEDTPLHKSALKLIANLSDDDLLPDRIGKLVARYRASKAFVSTAPEPAQCIGHADKAVKIINDLLANLKLMPESVEAEIFLSSGVTSDDLARDLRKYRRGCEQAIFKMKERPKKLGDNPNLLEHRLLTEVADVIESALPNESLIRLAGRAAEILIHAGISGMPGTDKKAREAIKTFRKKFPRE